jgi:FAD/FMN-containing dehydrogenase
VQYAVNATGASDYIETLAFAKKRKLRLVIRNTGHDYLGKSAGAGSLALWTHHLKDIAVLDYRSDSYTGKAMKVGAGVQASEAQHVAKSLRLVVVEGDCPTVGFAGGYTQGGGTSPLASKFGLAADQVLEWEVVTPTGKVLTATPDQNPDLYWALSGGGSGTYGIVLSMTVKLHPDMPTGGVTLSFTEPTEAYWHILQVFLMNLPAIVSAGAVVYWRVTQGNTFKIFRSYLPNGTSQDLERLLQPTLIALDQSGITYGIRNIFLPNS